FGGQFFLYIFPKRIIIGETLETYAKDEREDVENDRNTDIGNLEDRNSACLKRRFHGCLFLSLPGRSIRQRADGKYAPARSQPFLRPVAGGGPLCAAGLCLCHRDCAGGVYPLWDER